MMDWVEGQVVKGGRMIKGKKGGIGGKNWGMMMEFHSGFARDICGPR